jgi:hypothetical protein
MKKQEEKNDNSENQSLNQNKMDKNRKMSLIFLSVFSVAIIVFAFLSFNNTLRGPFESQLSKKVESDRTVCVDGHCFPEGVLEGDLSGLDRDTLEPENLDLKLIDTDGDEISDWDELFVYETSPYLADTSGDGINDYDAIFVHGIDPLCPRGEDCYGDSHQYDIEREDDLFTEEMEGMDDLNLLLESLDDMGEMDENLLEDLLEDDDYSSEDIPDDLQPDQVSPDELRQILLEGGLSQEEIDQLSDEDIMDIYQETFSDF